MTGIPLEELGATPRERNLLKRVAVVVGAVAIGVGVGVAAYARAAAIDAKIDAHLVEVDALRPQMIEKAQAIEEKLDVLIEDCYRRGGCRRR